MSTKINNSAISTNSNQEIKVLPIPDEKLYLEADIQRSIKYFNNDFGGKLNDEMRIVDCEYNIIIIKQGDYLDICQEIINDENSFEYELQKPKRGVFGNNPYDREHIIISIIGGRENTEMNDRDIYIQFLHSADGATAISKDNDIEKRVYLKISESQMLNHYYSISDSIEIEKKIELYKRKSKIRKRCSNNKTTRL